MNPTPAFRIIGVVEGFYGRVWSPAERADFIAALAPFGLNTYLYAPKHEPALGTDLLEPLPREAAGRLSALAQTCAAAGARLWAGLHLEPPFDATRSDHRAELARKALHLLRAGVQGLAVLFDDLPNAAPAAGPGLAERQARAFTALRAAVDKRVPGVDWVVCPSRYTLDPVLEATYGAFPPDYLAGLDAALPPDVPWLWTGPQVCSASVTGEHLAAYRAHLAPPASGRPGPRPVMLWDNYPVNDAAMAGQLHLGPLGGRAADLPAHVDGYLFNPLLQPRLGVLPGATCLRYAAHPAAYDSRAAWQAALDAVLPAKLHEAVTELAALTRTGEGDGSAGVAAPGATGNLPPRLARTWDAVGRGEPIEPYVLLDFRRVMNQLQQGLPADLRAEATPWLGRLWRALRLFEAAAEGAPQEVLAPLRAEFAEWREAGPVPHVLGPWFP